jgi:hypothetical protein
MCGAPDPLCDHEPYLFKRRHQLRLAIDIGLARGAQFLKAVLIGALLRIFWTHTIDEHE